MKNYVLYIIVYYRVLRNKYTNLSPLISISDIY